MTDQAIAMGLLVGELRGEMKGVIAAVENLNKTWGEREKDATEGRRLLHQKMDAVVLDSTRTEAVVENLTRTIDEIKPAIEEFKTQRNEKAGESKLKKRAWAGAVSLSGIFGGGIAELFHYWRGH